MQTTEIS